MESFMLIVVVIILFIIMAIFKALNDADENSQVDVKIKNNDLINLPYSRKYLLTKNELSFYKGLKEYAERNNYAILTKIRLADLVEVSGTKNKSEWSRYFSKIKSKHIDFALCNKDNLYPVLLIELNDNSHNSPNRVKRDEFYKALFNKTGYKLIFTYSIKDFIKQTEALFPAENR